LGHESPNQILGAREKYFRFSSKEKENNFQKILENSRKTLKIDEHILKDNHILKLNILGCDICHHGPEIKVKKSVQGI
jgi:predicted metallo-beta-lactamase superfamily hydrolase